MTSHDLKVWLTVHSMTQAQLAAHLRTTNNTINLYCNKRPPYWMQYALLGLEIELNKGK